MSGSVSDEDSATSDGERLPKRSRVGSVDLGAGDGAELAAFTAEEERWMHTEQQPASLLDWAHDRLGLSDACSREEATDAFHRSARRVVALYNDAMEACSAPAGSGDEEDLDEDAAASALESRWAALHSKIMRSYELVRASLSLRADAQEAPRDVIDLMSFTYHDVAALSPLQCLLAYLLTSLRRLSYRKWHDEVYCSVKTDSGYDTHAWQQVCTIEEFVWKSCDKNENFAQWSNLTAGSNNARVAVEHLKNVPPHSGDFPTLDPDPTLLAFSDGWYMITSDEFLPYDAHTLPSTSVACKYHPVSFFGDSRAEDVDEGENFMDMDTPEDPIFKFQGFDDDTQQWAMALLGRALFPMDADRWQVAPFFIGVGGSGKSTLANVLKSVLPQNMTMEISAQGEEVFGLEGLARNPQIITVSEAGQHMRSLSSKMLQMIIDNQRDLPVARKGKEATTFPVDGKICIFGNEFPSNWNSVQGAVQRRLIMFMLESRVLRADPDLENRIARNIGQVVRRWVRAYLHKRALYGVATLHGTVVDECTGEERPVLPEQIRDFCKRQNNDMDTLYAFLTDSDRVALSEGSVMPRSDFVSIYQEYRQRMGHKKVRWNESHYIYTFKQLGVEIQTGTRTYQGKTVENGSWVVGVASTADETMEYGL